MAIKTSLEKPEWEILEGVEGLRCDGCGKIMKGAEEFYALQGWMSFVMLNAYFCLDCYPKYKEHCCCEECDKKWQTRAKYIVRTREFDEKTIKWAEKILKN